MHIFQPYRCTQCGEDSVRFHYDGASQYTTDCGRCGHQERHTLEYDAEGSNCGFTHVVRKGAGVLWFRYSGEPPIYCHYLHAPAEVMEASDWLRERLRTGAVETETAFLTQWNEPTRQIEVVIGELLDFLAGKVVAKSGLPVDPAESHIHLLTAS